MANPSDIPVNGTSTNIDPATISTSSTSVTPKSKMVSEIKTNGYTAELAASETNGTGAVSSTDSHSSLSPPPPSSPPTTVSQGDAAESASVGSESANEGQIEGYHSETAKRDLYVGNLYLRLVESF